MNSEKSQIVGIEVILEVSVRSFSLVVLLLCSPDSGSAVCPVSYEVVEERLFSGGLMIFS